MNVLYKVIVHQVGHLPRVISHYFTISHLCNTKKYKIKLLPKDKMAFVVTFKV